MRSHGSGTACYRGQRPATGSCEACRKTNARLNRPATARYKATALGMLNDMRDRAKRRKS